MFKQNDARGQGLRDVRTNPTQTNSRMRDTTYSMLLWTLSALSTSMR